MWTPEDAQRYLRNNLDVLRAYEASDKSMGPTLFAQRHYEQHGQKEGRKSGADLDPTRPQPGVKTTSPLAGMTDEQIVAQHEARQNNWRGTGRPRPGGNPTQQAVAMPPPVESFASAEEAVNAYTGIRPGSEVQDEWVAKTGSTPGHQNWWSGTEHIPYKDFRLGEDRDAGFRSRADMMRYIADIYAGQKAFVERGEQMNGEAGRPSYSHGWHDPNYLRAIGDWYNQNRQYAGPEGEQWGDLPTLDYDLIGREMRKASGLTDEQMQSVSGLTGVDRMNALNSMAGSTRNASGTWNNRGRQPYRWYGTTYQPDVSANPAPQTLENPLGKQGGGVVSNYVAPPTPTNNITPGMAGGLGVMGRQLRR